MEEKEIIEILGKNIKEARKRNNMTQSELAEKLGVSKQVVSSYENGKRSPSYEMLLKIANVFCTTINDLLSTAMSVMNISLDGLNNSQIEIVMKMIDEFKSLNKKR